VLQPHVDALRAHVRGHQGRLVGVEGKREIPVLADHEGDMEAAVLKDLRDLDPDQSPADDHGTLPLLRLAVERLVIAESDVTVHAGTIRTRPRRLPGLRTTGDEQLVVREPPTVAEDQGPRREINTGRCGPHSLESHPRIEPPVVGLGVLKPHLPGEHVHERGPGEEMIRLGGDDGNTGTRIMLPKRHGGFDSGHAVAQNDVVHKNS
jgi:hypothetical protein